MNFWQKFPKPFSMLSPMEDITDTVFRQMLIKTGKPDVFFTEFVNVDGMFSVGKNNVRQRLIFHKKEKPIVAQIWGNSPNNFYKAAIDIAKLNFDGIDINMGCAQKEVVKKSCGAGLIGKYDLTEKIILAVKKGIEFSQKKIPLSIKTRIGLNNIITKDWIGFLLKFDLSAITIHGRTAKENYLINANWNEIQKAVNLRNEISPNTLIIGNGDIKNWQEIKIYADKYQVDGVAIGRGILNDPWAFSKITKKNLQISKRFKLLTEYINLFEKTWENRKNFSEIKKFIKMYIQGFEKASFIRNKLMQAKNYTELKTLLNNLIP